MAGPGPVKSRITPNPALAQTYLTFAAGPLAVIRAATGPGDGLTAMESGEIRYRYHHLCRLADPTATESHLSESAQLDFHEPFLVTLLWMKMADYRCS